MTIRCYYGRGWAEPLSEDTSICRADSNIGVDDKPWFAVLAQKRETPEVILAKPERMEGRKFLLTQDECTKFVKYLLDASLIGFDENGEIFVIDEVPYDENLVEEMRENRKRTTAK